MIRTVFKQNKGLTLFELTLSLFIYGLMVMTMVNLYPLMRIDSNWEPGVLVMNTFLGQDFRELVKVKQTSPTFQFSTSKEDVEYQVQGDELYRLSPNKRVFLSRNISQVKFKFFDGTRWSATWANHAGIHGVPLAVGIECRMGEEDKLFIFPVMVSVLNSHAT